MKRQNASAAFLAITLVLATFGCSTAERDESFTTRLDEDLANRIDDPTPVDRVIARIDGMDSRPDWLKESEPFVLDSGSVVSLGVTEIPGDHRIEAAYRIAESNADAAIAGAIEKRLEVLFQNAEEGTAMDDRQARYIAGEATRLVTSSLRPRHRYWEKILSTGETGRRLIKYRVFATVEMPEAEFRQAIVEATRRASGKAGLSQDFSEKVDRQWNHFIDPKPAEDKSEDEDAE